MRNKKSTKSIALLTALMLITSLFVGLSVARYVTSTSSEDDARIAIWGINEGGTEMNLFKNEYKLEDDTIVAKSNNGDNIIAPGLNGVSKFKFLVASANLEPEVMYEFKISLDDSQVADAIKNHPGIQWKVDNGNWVTWDEFLTELKSLSGDPSGIKIYGPGEIPDNFQENIEHTIAWQWLMDSGYDEEDTRLANLAIEESITAKIVVTVTAEQTDIDTTGMLEGNNSTFNLLDPQPLTFRADADYETFDNVEINGESLASSNYTTEEGSIIVKLKKEYLKTLPKGDYTITINTTDGKAIKSRFTITENSTIVHNGIIPEGGTYYQNAGTLQEDWYIALNDYSNATVFTAGQPFPQIPQTGDVYVYEGYEYKYNYKIDEYVPEWYIWVNYNEDAQNGWGVRYIGTSNEPQNILTTINNKSVVNLDNTFASTTITKSPTIPKTTKNMFQTYMDTDITKAPVIPENVEEASLTFAWCYDLEGTIEINATNLKNYGLMLNQTKISWITGSISEDLKQAIARDSGITLIKPTKVITDSWETIAQRVKSGKANEYYSVGDKATVKVNGEDKEVVIIGIDHDGENTITFSFTEEVTSASMNPNLTNVGGWENSSMRTNTMQSIYNSMNNKDYIIEVEKQTFKGYGDGGEDDSNLLVTTNDKLFLLSLTEVGFPGVEGSTYEYFKTQTNRIMKDANENNTSWWLRTPHLNYDANFYMVDSESSEAYYISSSDKSVIPAFVIG